MQTPPSIEMGLKRVPSLQTGTIEFLPTTANSSSRIALLIHGWIGRPKGWETMIKNLQNESNPSYTEIWTFGYNSSLSINDNASKLEQELSQKLPNTVKVDIIAHSMGGLVSRSMIEQFGGAKYVNKLITLGTPHTGTYAAFLRAFVGGIIAMEGGLYDYITYDYNTQGFKDLESNSNFIKDMKKLTQPTISYFAIASTNNPKLWVFSYLLPGDDDGLVQVESALGVPGLQSTSTINIPVAIAHSAMTSNSSVYQQVLTYLRTSQIPVLTTSAVTNITQTSATSGGNITSDGGLTVTSRGVCWSTGSTPTIYDSKTNYGTGTGSFTSNITGLTANTTYYVRAYATNSAGTGYGNTVSFKTTSTSTGQLPVVTTSAITSITQTTATSGGNIISDGGLTVTSKGVCWNTGSTPTINDSKTNNGTGTGSFTSSITGLLANTTYYVRAYATNSAGTGYGNAISLSTNISGQDYWQKISDLAANTMIINSSNHIFVGTYDKGIYRSTNNGISWIQTNSGLTNFVISSFAISPEGYILCATLGGGIFRSTNNGDSWSSINSPRSYLTRIKYNAQGLFVCDGHWCGGIYRSTDNGISWIDLNIPAGCTNDFVVNNSGHLIVGTGTNGIYKTTNMGLSWTNVSGGNVNLMCINSQGIIFAATTTGLLRTTNNCVTWINVNNNLPTNAVAVNSIDRVFMSTYNNSLSGASISTDNGNTWVQINSGIPGTGISGGQFNFDNSGYIWASFGSSIESAGAIWRSTKSTTSTFK
jgi:pimeloyl-ACP methyl ester carboxylesterase